MVLVLNTDYFDIRESLDCKNLIFTGPIDEYFEYMYGILPYRSLKFDFQLKDESRYQTVGTVNYPNEYDFTRITEQKILPGQDHKNTVIAVEYPMQHKIGATIPYYPIPTENNRALFQKYKSEQKKHEKKIKFAGRLGDYAYYNMDQAIERALSVFSEIRHNQTI